MEFAPFLPPRPKKLDGKTVIITSANTGIGKETAIDQACRIARVIMLNVAYLAAACWLSVVLIFVPYFQYKKDITLTVDMR